MKSQTALLFCAVILSAVAVTWVDATAQAEDAGGVDTIGNDLAGMMESSIAAVEAEPAEDTSAPADGDKGGKKGKGGKGKRKGIFKKSMKGFCKKFEEKKSKWEKKAKGKGAEKMANLQKCCDKVKEGSDTDDEDMSCIKENFKGGKGKFAEKLKERMDKWKGKGKKDE